MFMVWARSQCRRILAHARRLRATLHPRCYTGRALICSGLRALYKFR